MRQSLLLARKPLRAGSQRRIALSNGRNVNCVVSTLRFFFIDAAAAKDLHRLNNAAVTRSKIRNSDTDSDGGRLFASSSRVKSFVAACLFKRQGIDIPIRGHPESRNRIS